MRLPKLPLGDLADRVSDQLANRLTGRDDVPAAGGGAAPRALPVRPAHEPQRVVLLGGTSDIGLALVRRLGRERPLDVVLAGRPGPRLSEAVAALVAEGHTARAVPLDARAPSTWSPALAEAFGSRGVAAGVPVGPVDVVVLAVGVLPDGKRSWQDPTAAADLVQVNTAAPVALAAEAAQRLRAQRGGALVVLSSAAAVRARSTDFAYGASKAGLDAFASGLREAVRGDGVRVVVVRPGFVRTRMTAGRSAWLATTKEAVADLTVQGLELERDVVWAPPGAQAVTEVLRWAPPRLLRRLRL
ncbi:SDR family NAD(P)-dependent oxidoreductase [Streptomyces sp. NP160]|uniref:SDR family NAD(P)-dependent oxidoreductase n=1 Tax=Streptomyces sp. NP160 TaxID=2586637 RepID=UPI0015D5973B|nr:SDR family NAD(P)-dependent oxidoreductase [Streptomyces sp. NP160]